MLATFLQWVSGLPALAQVPIVIGVFLLVALLVIFFIEVAPRSGTRYTVLRLAAAVGFPLLVFVLLGSVCWALGVAVVLGGLFFLLDYRARQGEGYLFQLIGFLSPALFLLAIGLVYPTIATFVKAFLNGRGNRFVGVRQLRLDLHPAHGHHQRAQHDRVGAHRAHALDDLRPRLRVLHRQVPRREVLQGAGLHADGDLVRRRQHHLALRLRRRTRRARSRSACSTRSSSRSAANRSSSSRTVRWNNLFLMVVLIWVQTGFAMVVLSAAIKGVPVEQLEAARIDGTNAWQRFINVTVPGIRSALVVVLTTISIASLKVFDIVRTMTAGTNGTSVLANEMYTQWKGFEDGRSSALAVVLFVLVLPIVIYNARQIKLQREIR